MELAKVPFSLGAPGHWVGAVNLVFENHNFVSFGGPPVSDNHV